jgi:uncharacterized protein (TIGR03435 family)
MPRLRVVAAGALIVLMAGGAAGVSGQSAAESRFEVASIKTAMSPAEMGRAAAASGAANGGRMSFPLLGVHIQPGGRLVGIANLQTLILRAYGIREYQIEGGPTWLTTDYFDIVAKAERETATEVELNEMLKSLLAERFGLRVHVETRRAPVHTLTLARADGRLGRGLTRTSQECQTSLEERKRTGARSAPPSGPPTPGKPMCGLTTMSLQARNGPATYTMGGQSLAALVERISSELGAPVIDRTGLTGLFDVVLEYESTRRPAGMPAAGLDPNSTDPLPVPLPAALQDQLGLKLEKGVGPLPITIIDAAELPSPN